MIIDRFALGMRMPAGAHEPEYCLELFLKGFAPRELKGLTLRGGVAEDMFIIVIMGGGLGRMRKVYRAIRGNGDFCALLSEELPIIENNRLLHLPELENYGTGDEHGGFAGGNQCFGLRAGRV